MLVQRLARVRWGFVVPPRAFTPAPRVASAVIRIELRQRPSTPADARLFGEVVHAAFRARRKTLRNALLQLVGERGLVDRALTRAQLDGRRRGETLSVAEFGALTRTLWLERGAP